MLPTDPTATPGHPHAASRPDGLTTQPAIPPVPDAAVSVTLPLPPLFTIARRTRFGSGWFGPAVNVASTVAVPPWIRSGVNVTVPDASADAVAAKMRDAAPAIRAATPAVSRPRAARVCSLTGCPI